MHTTNYPEIREKTTVLLRQILALWGQHEAALNPLCFAVLYEHAAGSNRRLSEAIEQALKTQPKLDDAAMADLYQRFVAEASGAQAERIRSDMQRVMTDIAASAARTGQTAGQFGESLNGLSGALSEGNPAALATQLRDVLAGTQAMQGSAKALQAQVDQSQREIEQLRHDLVRVREEATLCPLTRVLNRRGFEEKFEAMLRQPPPRGAAHCLIMIDIDHFKRVNDTHGHQVGDRVIEGLGEVLRSVPPEPAMSCARYGGEEFAILLPATTLNRATQVAELVRSRTRTMKLRQRSTQQALLTVTVSAGVAAWQPGEDAHAFLSCADAALYRSKENGRDRVTVA